MNILILGVNGFIGSHLLEHILSEKKDWNVTGLDIADDNLDKCIGNGRFNFLKGDVFKEKEWISNQVEKCDVVLPLVAIATPMVYVKNPLLIFELDFESNIEIVRLAAKNKKRVVFPSTSEVYGMCQDEEFDEEFSNFVQGPISKQRWIYSCSKQLLDRVIYAYGDRDGLDFTLFRPFNWIGPRLDRLHKKGDGSSRSVTQFLHDILYTGEIKLVDGGEQKRCFIDIEDAISALVKIIENQDGIASGKIYNIGNTNNEWSIKSVAEKIVSLAKEYPSVSEKADAVKLINTSSQSYYGASYQDVSRRVPSIKKITADFGWEPKTNIDQSLRKILDFYFS